METQNSSSEKSGEIIPLNKKGIARILGVSVYILNRMIDECLEELGKPTGTMYSLKQVEYLANKFGVVKFQSPKIKLKST